MKIIKYLKNKKIIFICIACVLIIVIFLPKNKKEATSTEVIENTVAIAETKEIQEVYFYVDIKGEVNNPGVYKLIEGSRVIDVINAAGGLKDLANTRYINLSKKISDEMNIIVYSYAEIESFKDKEIIIEPCICENIKNDSCIENIGKDETSLININTASKDELMKLDGIGEAKANAIIEYRKNKLFETIEEITEVNGISDTMYSKIKDLIITE